MPKKPPATLGIIYRMPLEDLHPHPLNPYGVRDDPAMQELVGSVKENGVLIPAIARPRKEGGYELISGHRRKYACEELLVETIGSEQSTPSLSQAQRLKRLSQSGELNEDTMLSIMSEQKKPVQTNITLSGERLRKYFPRSYSPLQMEEIIFKLLEAWQRKRQREQSR